MTSGGRPRRKPTGKQAVLIDYGIEALGPYYAGTKTRGRSTTLLGYYGRLPVPALSVTSEPPPVGEDDERVPPAFDVHVLLPDIVNVALLEHRLNELAAEEAALDGWRG